jgi:dTDP-glucose pyrophosphorylase
MHIFNRVDLITLNEETSIEKITERLFSTYLSAVLIAGADQKLKAIITEGDIRRYHQTHRTDGTCYLDLKIDPLNFCFVTKKDFEIASQRIKENNIRHLPVLDDQGVCESIITTHEPKTVDCPFLSNIPVVINAGGEGTRLRPHTFVLPKPLIPINDRAIIERIIEDFYNQGFRKFHIIGNYLFDILVSYIELIRSTFPKAEIETHQEREPLGTIGALSLLKNRLDRPFVLSNCDVMVSTNWATPVRKLISEEGCIGNYLTYPWTTKVPYGVVRMKEGYLCSLEEKPIYKNDILCGVYVLKPEIFERALKGERLDVDGFTLDLVNEGKRILTHEVKSWVDMGTEDAYSSSQRSHRYLWN